MAVSHSQNSPLDPLSKRTPLAPINVGYSPIRERHVSGVLASAEQQKTSEVEVLSAWTQWLLKIEEQPRELLPLLSSAVPLLTYCLQADCIVFHPSSDPSSSNVIFRDFDSDPDSDDEDGDESSCSDEEFVLPS